MRAAFFFLRSCHGNTLDLGEGCVLTSRWTLVTLWGFLVSVLWIMGPFSHERSPVSKVSREVEFSPQILDLSGGTCWLSLLLWASLSELEQGSGGALIGQHSLYYRQYMSSTSLMLTGIWLIHCHEGRFTPEICWESLDKSFKLLRSEK